ncbi:unnamed protein product [Boreogadus saida]
MSVWFLNVRLKVVTPTRVGQSYTYSPGQHDQQDLYDVPPCRAAQGVYDIPPAKTPGSSLYSGKHASARPEGVYDVPPSQPDLRNQGIYDIPPSSQAVYSVPPCRVAPVLQEGTYDFPQPLKQPQEGIYDVPPPALTKPPVSPESPYDFPPNSELPGGARLHYPAANGNEGIYDVLPPTHHSDAARCHGDLYDIPRGMQTLPPHRTPPGAVPAFPPAGERCDRGRGVYDMLPAQDSPRAAVADATDGVNRLSFSSTGSTRSSMSTSSSSTGSGAEGRLPLDLDAAVQRLFRLQQAVEASVGAVQTLAASPHWRTFAFMERHADDVRAALDRVRAALGDFLVFGRGAAANATALSDPGLHSKLRRQLGRLEDSQQILLQTYQALEACGWAVGTLASPPSSRQQQHHHHHHHHAHHAKSDELDRFVMVSRTVPDDAKQLASSVNGGAELLFRRSSVGDGGSLSRGGTPEESLSHPQLPYPSPDNNNDNYGCQVKAFPVPSGQEKDNMNNSEKCVKSWMEDYDYVHLQGKEDFERQQKELLDKENIIKQSKVQLGQEQINQFKKLEQEVAKPVENDITQWVSHQHSSPLSDSSPSPSLPLTTTGGGGGGGGGGARVCAHDRQLLVFYAQQCEQHFVTLLSAVDAFFACVGAGQPPRIFVAHGKFVILSAHKLVFIGDTLSRQASAPEVANRVMNASNVLCDLLKTVVGSTKMAALNYPSTGAVQEMVDRVTELSHHAQQFKEQLLQMAAL